LEKIKRLEEKEPNNLHNINNAKEKLKRFEEKIVELETDLKELEERRSKKTSSGLAVDLLMEVQAQEEMSREFVKWAAEK
jgi:deoxyhypusine synthase